MKDNVKEETTKQVQCSVVGNIVRVKYVISSLFLFCAFVRRMSACGIVGLSNHCGCVVVAVAEVSFPCLRKTGLC